MRSLGAQQINLETKMLETEYNTKLVLVNEADSCSEEEICSDTEIIPVKEPEPKVSVIKEKKPTKKAGKKRANTTVVPRWPQLPEIGATQETGPCEIWPGEQLVFPESLPVSITIPASKWLAMKSAGNVVEEAGGTRARISERAWYCLSHFPFERQGFDQTFSVAKVGTKHVLNGTWKIKVDSIGDFYYCHSEKLEFELDWESHWTEIARARQQRWGTHPQVAVPAFMRHLESMSKRHCIMTPTHLRVMGYPVLSEGYIAHSDALGSLSGRWYCRVKPLSTQLMHIGDGILVHPRPFELLPHALTLEPLNNSGKTGQCTLIIYDNAPQVQPNMPLNSVHITTIAELTALNRRDLKRGNLTLLVRGALFANLPSRGSNEFAGYNARKKAGLPTVFTDIEWGRVIIISQDPTCMCLPPLPCAFRWTLCTPDVAMRVGCDRSHVQAWLSMAGENRCNRHRMLQFFE